MNPVFLVPEATVDRNGESTALPVPGGSFVLLTLGIQQVVEQESLQLSVHASADGTAWEPAALAEFPQKFLPGTSAILLNQLPEGIGFIRAQWKLNRWGRGDKQPLFRFYLFAEPL